MTLNTNIKTTIHYNLDCANGLWEICDCGAESAWVETSRRSRQRDAFRGFVWKIECSECGMDYVDFLENNMTQMEIDEAQEDNN